VTITLLFALLRVNKNIIFLGLINVGRLFQVYFYIIKRCAHISIFVYLYIVISGQTAGSKCLKFFKIHFNIFFFQKSKFYISNF